MSGTVVTIRSFAVNPGPRYPHPKQQHRDQQNPCRLAKPKASIMIIYLVQSRASTNPNRKGRAQYLVSDIIQENNPTEKTNSRQVLVCQIQPIQYRSHQSSPQWQYQGYSPEHQNESNSYSNSIRRNQKIHPITPKNTTKTKPKNHHHRSLINASSCR